MRIGIAYDLKPTEPPPAWAPDDWHEEFDSPATVESIAAALRELGHEPVLLGNGTAFLQAMLTAPPELVFNIAEGTGISRNRESRVPAVCEMLGVPHTGSDPLTLGLALDKGLARQIVAEAGVIIAKGFVFQATLPYDDDYAEFAPVLEAHDLTLPVIAKPVCEGSSKGIRNRCLIRTIEELGPTLIELATQYQQPVLVEEFIRGDEVTVGITGYSTPEVLGAMRIVPQQANPDFVYSLEVKRNWEAEVRYECPAQLPAATLAALEQAALTAFDALGCRDVARLDFRVRDGVPVFIECNPLPGLNPTTGDLCILSKAMNVTHTELIARIIAAAQERIPTKA
jgi:D-alanine-D-alanine ligase